MEMLSISSEFSCERRFPKSAPFLLGSTDVVPIGIPSITKSGWLDAVELEIFKLVAPRMVTNTEPFGSVLELVKFTPLTRPSNDLITLGLAPLAKSFPFTSDTESVSYTHLRAHETDS